MTVDRGYTTEDRLSRRLSSTGGDDRYSEELESAITTASRSIDTYTGQVFYKDSAVSSFKVWPDRMLDCGFQVVTLPLPMWEITSVATDDDDDGTAETTWTVGTDYVALPLNAVRSAITGWPAVALRALGTKPIRRRGRHPAMTVTGKVGWSSVPEAVRTACEIIAADLVKLREAPFGVLGVSEFGGVRVSPEITRRVTGLLRGFCVASGSGIGGFA
jgi:hypothetical protein